MITVGVSQYVHPEYIPFDREMRGSLQTTCLLPVNIIEDTPFSSSRLVHVCKYVFNQFI